MYNMYLHAFPSASIPLRMKSLSFHIPFFPLQALTHLLGPLGCQLGPRLRRLDLHFITALPEGVNVAKIGILCREGRDSTEGNKLGPPMAKRQRSRSRRKAFARHLRLMKSPNPSISSWENNKCDCMWRWWNTPIFPRYWDDHFDTCVAPTV